MTHLKRLRAKVLEPEMPKNFGNFDRSPNSLKGSVGVSDTGG